MINRNLKWMRVGMFGVPLLILSAALFLASGQQRAMARLFTLVPGTKNCVPFAGSMWRSASKVVCVASNRTGAALLGVDSRSGEQKTIAVLPANEQILSGFGVMVSPDGKWLLWPGLSGGWRAMSLGGKRFVQRQRATQSTAGLRVAWLPDSSGWVEASPYGLNGRNGDTILIIYSLKNAKTRVINVPEADGINNFQVTSKDEAVFSCSEPVSVRFVTKSLALSSKSARELDIKPPFKVGSGRHINGTLVSPDGKRIAWTFQIMGGQKTTESVWLSDRGGKNFKRLTPDLDMQNLAPRYLHWMPDGKRLSCWRDNSLYILNIP